MDFIYKKADISDLDILIRTRIEVLRAANELSAETDMSLVEQETSRYYESCFADDTHAAYFVYHNSLIVGSGGVSFYKVMPTFHNPSGRCAYIMNMYTKPEYRRKGIATNTLDLLVKEAKGRGIDRITLEATRLGKLLYERYGFVSLQDEMFLPQ